MVGSLLAVGAGQLSAAAIAEKLALGKSQMPGKTRYLYCARRMSRRI